ncbi:D-site 20S pre-rRNA nuclease [Corynespora cassiicola Philippines]|uniref:20S-pre-rRNA D-site endonuclease NOB1 n=1 Tax=Corynespora cassiicola Philippines TaxID=1448308 RepID=A0A2T2P9Y5_CORCC|nr:D-site 20S pre-rRNA nuclease [Corynespora cassiicola Philippines]
MATTSTEKPIHSLIVDTGPLIKNTISISTIINQAEELYTTPAIISEIRDPATRANVENTLLPFLKVRSPSPASYEAVTAFSKKTGDFPVLSRQDLGILALAYEIHCQKHGGPWGLRNAPGQPLNARPGEKNQEDGEASTQREGTEAPNTQLKNEATPETEQQEGSETAPTEAKPVEPEVTAESAAVPHPAEATPVQESLDKGLADLEISDNAEEAPVEPTVHSDEDDDSDGEWITPGNLSSHKAKDSGVSAKTAPQIQMSVATMTTDFAMQNVLLQMNMHLLSTNLQRISNLRTYVLRCHACFLTTKEMTKQFCPRCGQATLHRVSCTTNAKGEFKIHLSKNFQWNNRGNRYSVPKPVAGTANGKYQGKGGGKGGWGRDLILAEDQKEYTRQVDEQKRSKTRDLMDDDYLPGILTGDRGRAGGRPKVGAGKNVNSRKRH